MKEGWNLMRIGDVCKVIAGQSPPGKYYNKECNGLPFYQGKKEFGDKFIGNPVIWTSKITKEALKNDILMSVRAPVGPVNFSTQKICIGRGLAAIRSGSQIDKDFLYNFLLKHESEIIGNTGAVFNSINKSQIEALKIPVPPLTEQKRIVSILDKAFAAIDKAIANTEKNLQNARELFDSYLKEFFSNPGEDWNERKLGECFKLKSGDGLTQKNMIPGNYKVFGGNGVAGLHNKYNLCGENLIVGRVGALCGNVRYIKENIWLTDNAFKIINYKSEFDFSFLEYLLNFLNLRIYARQAAQPVISNSSLKDVVLNFPKSINEQKQIVSKLDSLSKETKRLESIYNKKLENLKELKQSILQKVFEGEL